MSAYLTMPSHTLYIILGAVKGERGPPVAIYWDPIKARSDFDAIITTSMWFGDKQAYLVSYALHPDGSLHEIAELGAK
jgi:hypothetical protein